MQSDASTGLEDADDQAGAGPNHGPSGLDSGSATASTGLVLDHSGNTLYTFSQRYACELHPDELIPELEPRLFSFNAPQGACPTCTGLGTRMEIDPNLILNPNLTIAEGGIRPFNRINQESWWLKRLEAVGERHGFSCHAPISQLTEDQIQIILYGTGKEKYTVKVSGKDRKSHV